MDNRPPSSSGNRPASVRPFTSQRPSPTALPSYGAMPGTATRLISTANQRPGSRASIAQSVGKMSHIAVTERPMSQQGLVTPKTAGKISQRQVQDKSYFMGLLRAKINELKVEMSRMLHEMDSLRNEQSTYMTYEKRAELLAAELKELQGELADYNLLVDKLNTDTEMDEVQEEFREIHEQNRHEAEAVDRLFERRQACEAQLKQLESDISRERNMADNLIVGMKQELRNRYNELKHSNQQQQGELNQLQQKLDLLTGRKVGLEEELAVSQVKQEAIHLLEKLRELEERRDLLIEEEQRRGTPAQERERLLQQVKEDNAELASIERQTTEIKEQIVHAKEDLSQLEQDLEDQQGERTSKYRELKKREETMDSFLSTFDEMKSEEDGRRQQLESSVVLMLERISRSLAHFHHLPTPQELAVLKDDLSFKEGEMEKSRSTVSSLGQEQKKLNMDLQKIEQLETKIQQELETLRLKIKTMEDEMVIYEDIDKLKSMAENKHRQLLEEEHTLHDRRGNIKNVLKELEDKYESLKRALQESDTHIQLSNLERKWQQLEQNNFSVKQYIAEQSAQTDYRPLITVVKTRVSEINKLLQDNVSKSTVS